MADSLFIYNDNQYYLFTNVLSSGEIFKNITVGCRA